MVPMKPTKFFKVPMDFLQAIMMTQAMGVTRPLFTSRTIINRTITISIIRLLVRVRLRPISLILMLAIWVVQILGYHKSSKAKNSHSLLELPNNSTAMKKEPNLPYSFNTWVMVLNSQPMQQLEVVRMDFHLSISWIGLIHPNPNSSIINSRIMELLELKIQASKCLTTWLPLPIVLSIQLVDFSVTKPPNNSSNKTTNTNWSNPVPSLDTNTPTSYNWIVAHIPQPSRIYIRLKIISKVRIMVARDTL